MQIWLLISAAVLALLLHYVSKVCESCLSSNDSASSTPSHSAHHCSSSAAVATDRLAKEGTGHQREREKEACRHSEGNAATPLRLASRMAAAIAMAAAAIATNYQ